MTRQEFIDLVKSNRKPAERLEALGVNENLSTFALAIGFVAAWLSIIVQLVRKGTIDSMGERLSLNTEAEPTS